MGFDQVRQRRLSDDIVEQLEGMILEGTLKSGERLPAERALAERFGVMPELFVADNPLGHDMVHSDVINLKVRHFLAVFVADYRPLYKANVA